MSHAPTVEIDDLLNEWDPSQEQEVVQARKLAHDVAQGSLLPLDKQMDETGAFPHHLWEEVGKTGLLGVMTPQEYGGAHTPDPGEPSHMYITTLAIMDEFSQASGSAGLSFIAHVALCQHQIMKHGTHEQKMKYLPGLAAGKKIGALAMSETEAGSNVMNMSTSAKKVDGGYLLNGAKIWITNGARYIDKNKNQTATADVVVVYAVTDSNPGAKKLTAFIVEGGPKEFAPGIKPDKEGVRGSETWELKFDDCFVPDENVLGKVNQGIGVLMSGLNAERVILAGGALGLATTAYGDLKKYLNMRKQFGKAVGANQVPAFEVAQMYADLKAARLLAYNEAHQMDRRSPPVTPEQKRIQNRDASATFLKASQVGSLITDRNMHYNGGNGLTKDCRAGRLLRDAKLYPIGGGSEEMRKHLIAEAELESYRAAAILG